MRPSIARFCSSGVLAAAMTVVLAACQTPTSGVAPPTPTAGSAPTAPSAATAQGGPRSPETETTLEGFRQLLLEEVIPGRNPELMARAMANPFTIAYFQYEGGSVIGEEGAALILDTILPAGSVISYDVNRDISALLGMDPLSFMPPDAGVVDVVYSTGWGGDSYTEALIFIAQPGGTGRFYWQGILIAPTGFAEGSVAGGTPITTGGEGTLEGFRTALLNALTSRNYDLIALTLGDVFYIYFWQMEGMPLGPEVVVEQLRTGYLPPEHVITYNLDADITTILGGQDPAAVWGSDVNVADSIYSEGWGPDGLAEVVLTIAQGADGVFYWYGMIYAATGF